MNIDKSPSARGFIQSAQTLARRQPAVHAQHILKVLLDDPEGLCGGLIDKTGGRSREALPKTEIAFANLPKVQGPGAGNVYLPPVTSP